jgi:uncharacterized protein YceH (UPF0502 family)
VTKYEHRLQEVFNFTRGETAVMCVLLLRGAQTPGELRGRTERMHRFEEIDDVLGTLQKLMQREPSLATALPRQPGTKETRYAHLLSGEVEASESVPTVNSAVGADGDERVARLESEIATLRQEMAELREKVEALLS